MNRDDYRRVAREAAPLPQGITPPPPVDPTPSTLARRLADALGVEVTSWQLQVMDAHLSEAVSRHTAQLVTGITDPDLPTPADCLRCEEPWHAAEPFCVWCVHGVNRP